MTPKKIKIAALCMVALIAIIGVLNALMVPTESLTEDYALFQALSEVASEGDYESALQRVREELAKRKLEFVIDNNKLVVIDHPRVQFDVLDLGETSIASNDAMYACQELDDEDLAKVKIVGKADGENYYEVITRTRDNITYTKSKGEYTATPEKNWLLICGLGIIVIITVSAVIITAIPPKKKAPKTP